MFVALGLFLVVGVGLFALSIGEWCLIPVVELTNVQNAELTGCPVSSGVTVITTESSRGNINRFPELFGLKDSHGSSRNQQLDSNRRKDGSEWRYRKLVLSPCQSYRWWKAGPDANRFWINASIDLIETMGCWSDGLWNQERLDVLTCSWCLKEEVGVTPFIKPGSHALCSLPLMPKL